MSAPQHHNNWNLYKNFELYKGNLPKKADAKFRLDDFLFYHNAGSYTYLERFNVKVDPVNPRNSFTRSCRVKAYCNRMVSIFLPRVKVTPTKDLCPSRRTYSVLHDLVAFLMESDIATSRGFYMVLLLLNPHLGTTGYCKEDLVLKTQLSDFAAMQWMARKGIALKR